MTTYAAKYTSPLGNLTITSTDTHIVTIDYSNDEKTPSKDIPSVLKKCLIQLDEYFTGKRNSFSLPLEVKGTPFQKKVWQALQEIPYGQVKSYKDIAESVNHPKAFRAVGMANHVNSLPIIIPCHRVVGSDKKLVGYASGLDKKIWLLEHENKYLVR